VVAAACGAEPGGVNAPRLHAPADEPSAAAARLLQAARGHAGGGRGLPRGTQISGRWPARGAGVDEDAAEHVQGRDPVAMGAGSERVQQVEKPSGRRQRAVVCLAPAQVELIRRTCSSAARSTRPRSCR
jgi:hypothetical protein